jgi:hypothetical protein
MGAGGKMIAIALVAVVSYVLLAVILAAANIFMLRLGLNPEAPSIYNLAGNGLLQASSGAAVPAFFTAPGLLSVFGRGGAWCRLVSKYAKGFAVTFGAAALIYVGAVDSGFAFETIRT